ncbi:MAG TPA: hypothetical protein VFV53_08290 [Candidatus Limnocylindrales bacterium]|nr:hypothetical protein [Candidatus Limnocylindrales bacterium]
MDAPGSPPAAGPGSSRRPRSSLRLALAAAFVLAGVVWIGQGLGILTAGRSFMIGDPLWALIGAVSVVVGLVVAIRARRAA